MVVLSRFLLNYFIYGLGLVLLSLAASFLFASSEILISNYWILFGYLFFLTLIAFFISYLGIKKGDQIGAMAIMGGLVVKFIFALAFFIFLRFKAEENLTVLALNFFILYLLLTVFEVVSLLRILRLRN